MSVAFDLDLYDPADAVPAGVPAPGRPRLRLVPSCAPAVPATRPGAPFAAPARRQASVTPSAPRVTVLHAPVSAESAAPLRLTRRGVVVLSAVVAALAGALLWAAAASASGSSGAAPTRAAVPATVMVRPGDTVWSIAGRVAPGRDPRAEVDELRRLNHLGDPQIVPGQVLRVR